MSTTPTLHHPQSPPSSHLPPQLPFLQVSYYYKLLTIDFIFSFLIFSFPLFRFFHFIFLVLHPPIFTFLPCTILILHLTSSHPFQAASPTFLVLPKVPLSPTFILTLAASSSLLHANDLQEPDRNPSQQQPNQGIKMEEVGLAAALNEFWNNLMVNSLGA